MTDSEGKQAGPDPQTQRRIDEMVEQGQRHHYEAVRALKLGQRDLAARDFQRAVDDYSEVLRLDPQHLTAYLYRARVFEEMGEDDKAEADLAQARRLEKR